VLHSRPFRTKVTLLPVDQIFPWTSQNCLAGICFAYLNARKENSFDLAGCVPSKWFVLAMEGHMFGVHVEKIGDVAIIRCEGRMIGSDAVFKLRDEARGQRDSKILLLDLSELDLLGGDVLGMLVFLQGWARGLGIQLKLFDPPAGVRRRLQQLHLAIELEIASMDDLLSILDWEGPRNRIVESAKEAQELKAA
jgi:anti-anti-sigma regulatory factor